MSALHRSIAADHKPSPAIVGKNAKIFTPRRFSLEAWRDEYRDACVDLLIAAYPSPSRNACAKAAADRTGLPKDTFYRILAKETHVPDITAILAAAVLSGNATDNGLRAYALLQRNIEVGS